MVDCSGCKWKNQIKGSENTLNCINDNGTHCDYRCTPFQGDNFVNNYFSESFKEKMFCDGPENKIGCDERNLSLKNAENWNTQMDICVFNESEQKCEISEDVNLHNLLKNSNMYAIKNSEIYNEEYLSSFDPEKLIEINNSDLQNKLENPSLISQCSIENFYYENNCNLQNEETCEELEGCFYDFDSNTCMNKNLSLPLINFDQYYLDIYSNTNRNNLLNVLYERFNDLRNLNNWPCVDTQTNQPINCRNDSMFDAFYIKSQYLDLSNSYIDINVSPEKVLNDKERLISLINDRCFDTFGSSSCSDFFSEATLENIEEYSNIIRNHTISLFSELTPYSFDKLPYILLLELELYLEGQESENLEKIVGNIRDINNLQLYSEQSDFFITKLQQNQELRYCFNDLLYVENENELFDHILNNNIKNWETIHFEYIKTKIDRFIELSPVSINSCFKHIENINEHICKGEITTGTLSLIFLVLEIVGANIDINNIEQDNPNFELLTNVIIPRVPSVIKKIVDLSEYYEENSCGILNNKSKLLMEFYKQVMQTNKPVVNYHLFGGSNAFGNFFGDFINGNIYVKIILLLFIYLIISNVISILKRNK